MRQINSFKRKIDKGVVKKTENIASEKWLLRVRQADGKIRPISTFEFKPTVQTLGRYGPGTYYIQKVGRRFSKAEKITIHSSEEEKEIAKIDSLKKVSKAMPRQVLQYHKRAPKFEPTKPRVTTKKLPPHLVRKRKVRKKKVRRNRDLIKSYTSQIAPEEPSPIPNDAPAKTNNTIKLEKTAKMEQKGFQTSRMTSIVPKKTDMIPAGSERNTKGAYNTGGTSRLEPLKLQSSNGIKVTPTRTVSESKEIARLAAEPSYGSEVPQKKYIRCTQCMEKLCEEDDIALYRDEIIRCEFCGSYFCKECYKPHRCSESEVCFYCKTRFAKEQVYRAKYCMKAFCSQRCKDSCYDKNRDNPECRGCDREEALASEKEEEGNKDNDEEKPHCFGDYERRHKECRGCDWAEECAMESNDISCPDCGVSIDVDDPRTIICYTGALFCSWKCFRRHHRSRDLEHKGLTVKEYRARGMN